MQYLVEKRQLVIPGELLAEGDYKSGENTYQEENRVYSSLIGLANHIGKNVFVVAIKTGYMPIVGDLVIGKVIDMRLSGWIIDINAPYNAMLFTSDAFDRSFNARKDEMSDFLKVGDLIFAKVNTFDRTRDPILTLRGQGLGKVNRGHVIKIASTKIPRLIGKKGSMVNMVKRKTGCQITIGQNGLVLVSGENVEVEALAILAIRTIEKNAHTLGLTDKISKLLKKEEGD
ncbi:RNA-binding protein [Candidatus Bathyarchaeota archaeon]|nr:RNA-binding protein [Candidatus Bathyarchaeota archaeon]